MSVLLRYLGRKAAKRSHSLLHHHGIELCCFISTRRSRPATSAVHGAESACRGSHASCGIQTKLHIHHRAHLQSSSSHKPLTPEADGGQSQLSTCLASKTRQTDLAHLCLSTDWDRSGRQHNLYQRDPVHWHNVHQQRCCLRDSMSSQRVAWKKTHTTSTNRHESVSPEIHSLFSEELGSWYSQCWLLD